MATEETTKKKNWFARHKVLTTIAIILIVLVIILSWDTDSAQRGFNEGLNG